MLTIVHFKSSIRFTIVLVALFGFSCSSPNVDYETKGNDIDLSNVDSNLISSIEEVKKRFWNNTGWATELGMLCNFGWGGTRKWIYAFTDTWQTTNACYDLYDIKIQ